MLPKLCSEQIEKSRFSVKLNTVLFLKPAEEDTLEKMCRQSFGPSACKQGGGPSRSQRCYPALPRRNLTKFSLQNSFLRKRQFQFWSWQRGLTLMAWRQKGKQDRIRSSHLGAIHKQRLLIRGGRGSKCQNLLSKKTTKGREEGDKIGKMGRHCLWMSPYHLELSNDVQVV